MIVSRKDRNQHTANAVAGFWGKSLDSRDWYAIKAAEGGAAEILIYDIIGWPFVDAETFVRDLAGIDAGEIKVRINSPGGDVFDGTAIFNALREHPARIVTQIEGLAASMASIIALAGDTVSVADNAYYMIHNPWTIAIGDAAAFRQEADLLERIAGNLANTYVQKTGKSPDAIREWMDAETWFIGQELIENGFADRITGKANARATAGFDLSMFNKTPDTIDGGPAPKDIERALRDAGLSRSEARAFTAAGRKALSQCDAGDGGTPPAPRDAGDRGVSNLLARINGLASQMTPQGE